MKLWYKLPFFSFLRKFFNILLVKYFSVEQKQSLGGVVLSILQNSSEKTSIGVFSFSEVAGSRPAASLKRDSGTGVFVWTLRNFSEHLFLQNISGFCNSAFLIMKSCSKSTAEKQGKICWLVAWWSGRGFRCSK